MYSEVFHFIRELYLKPEGPIGLHEPLFEGNERKYVLDAIDSTFVSSVGEYVNRFERMMCDITGAPYAVATVNGTEAIHVALLLAGVEKDHEVITQPLTFIATVNAISYIGAAPVFVDVDRETMGLSPESVREFLEENAVLKNGNCCNRRTGRRIAACLPMHTFGLPARIDALADVCLKYNVPLVEDAAESLGSTFKKKHTGTFGILGAYSFNGNKIVTSGGGGCIVTADEEKAKRAKHITTTARIPHAWEYSHDEIGFNYRLTNLSAALGCAQLEQLPSFLASKREIAQQYKSFFAGVPDVQYIDEPTDSRSNFWLNAVALPDRKSRDEFLVASNANGIKTRPIWRLAHKMPMYAQCHAGNLVNAEWLEDRIVNLPSSVISNG
jgi:perosamine synthetase